MGRTRTQTKEAPSTRLQAVEVGERSLASYLNVVPIHILEALDREAEKLRGARILHLNATPYGGGVSELLRSGVPLLADLGLDVHWQVISGDEPFFRVTKAIHNGLQGDPRTLTQAERDAYVATSARNAELIQDGYDFVVVHDPQPAAILLLLGKGGAKWVWRCHIETSAPNPDTWAFLRGFLCDYDAAVFTLRDFVPPDLPIDRVAVIPPAIDPLSPKNLPLARVTARQVLDWIGVRLDAPLVTQVSRFDPWRTRSASSRRTGSPARMFPTCNWRSSARWRSTTRRAGISTASYTTRRPQTTRSSSSRT